MKATDMDILNCPNVSKTCESIENCPCESCDNNLGYLAVKMTYEKKEQRYEQLVQAARSMWLDMNNYLDAIYERAEVDCDMPLSDACFIGDVGHYKKQLEALGVLDD